MSDFLCGEMLEIDEIDGSNIYFKAKQWDAPLFNSFTLSDYIANDTRTQIYQLSFITGEQSDGRFMVTTAGDISTWVADDRAMCKVGSSISIYPTVATCKAPMATDGSDRMLVGYSTTDNNTRWAEVLNSTATTNCWNISGILSDHTIVFSANKTFYYLWGDLSAQTQQVVISNLHIIGKEHGIIYNDTSASNHGILIERCIIDSSIYGLFSQTSTDVIDIHSCLFVRQMGQTITANSASLTILNCLFLVAYKTYNLSDAAATITNCLEINSANVSSGMAGATINTSYYVGTYGSGTKKTIEELKVWNLNSKDGRPQIYDPIDETSPLYTDGTAGVVTEDIHGRTVAAGVKMIGASLPFEFTAASSGKSGTFNNPFN